MTKAKHQFYAPRGANPSIPLPAAPIALAHFAMDAQKPDSGARLSHNPRKNFFLSVRYLTRPNRFPERHCLRVSGSGAHLVNSGLIGSSTIALSGDIVRNQLVWL
jgi:hypothetical protein